MSYTGLCTVLPLVHCKIHCQKAHSNMMVCLSDLPCLNCVSPFSNHLKVFLKGSVASSYSFKALYVLYILSATQAPEPICRHTMWYCIFRIVFTIHTVATYMFSSDYLWVLDMFRIFNSVYKGNTSISKPGTYSVLYYFGMLGEKLFKVQEHAAKLQ